MTEAMDAFSFDEEAYDFSEKMHTQAPRGVVDKRICACGHSVSRHKRNTFITDKVAYICTPPKSKCPCKDLRPVLEVPNTKRFVMKTIGPGVAHALIRAVKYVKDNHPEEYKKIQWLTSPKCEQCDAEDVKVSPVNLGFDGRITEEANDITVFLCDPCRFPAGN